MKVRLLSVALCVLMLGFVFYAAPLFAQETVELSIWMNESAMLQEANKAIVAKFEKLHANVRIGIRGLIAPHEIDAIRTGFLTGQEPDILSLTRRTFKEELVEQGELVDMADWYEKYGHLIPKSADISTLINGRYYGIPVMFIELAHLYYNKDILKKYAIAVPQYWSEFMDACEKLKAQGELPIALANQWGNTGAHWLQRLLTETIGGSGMMERVNRTKPDVGPRWTDPKVIQAVQVFEDMVKKGWFPKEAATQPYDVGKMMFISGQGGFYEDGSWFTSGAAIPPDFNWGFFRFPHMQGEIGATRNGGVVSYLMMLSITSSSPHRKLCFDFLEFYFRPENARLIYTLCNQFPATVGALEGIELTEFEKAVMEFAETCDDNSDWLDAGLPEEVGLACYGEASIDICSGKLDAVTFCENMEKAHQKYLRETQK